MVSSQPSTQLSPGPQAGVDALGTRVLVIEDSPEFRQVVSAGLSQSGCVVTTATTGEEGVERCRQDLPDVVVLDLGLPGMDGLEVCRKIREFSNAYVVMLTGRDDEVDKLVGLASGADDYMTKPFSVRELAARVEALMRRSRMVPPASTIAAPAQAGGRLVLDALAHEVTFDGDEVALTRIEFELLAALTARPGMVFSRAMLLEKVWDTEWIDDHVVDVHIGNLRKKIDLDGLRHIKTVRGVGYRLHDPPLKTEPTAP